MKKLNWQYTFGEILIVIIGITIAFSMNKYAESSKNNELKSQYLSNLKNDIELDKKVLTQNVSEIEMRIALVDEVIPILNIDSQNKMEAIGKIFRIVEISNFTANDNTYQTLINSGDLNLIEDFNTRSAIEKHYSNYKVMEKSYLRQENIQKKYMADYFIYNVDYDAFSKGIFGFKDEALLKNILRSTRGSLELKRNATKDGISSCDTLIAVLNIGLKN